MTFNHYRDLSATLHGLGGSPVGEIDAGVEVTGRVRPPGAGRPKAIDAQPELLVTLDDLVEPESRGDPMCPLR